MMIILFAAMIITISAIIIASAVWRAQRTAPSAPAGEESPARRSRWRFSVAWLKWKTFKEFVSNTMHVVLFIGASLVLYYGAVYLKNNISADSSTAHTSFAGTMCRNGKCYPAKIKVDESSFSAVMQMGLEYKDMRSPYQVSAVREGDVYIGSWQQDTEMGHLSGTVTVHKEGSTFVIDEGQGSFYVVRQ